MEHKDMIFDMPFESVVLDPNWKQVAEVVLTPELNKQYMDALEDHNPLYQEDSPYGVAIAHPGLLHELAFEAMMRTFPVAPPKGQATAHAQQDTEMFYPVRIGTKVKVEVRLSEQTVKRERNYLLYESRIIDESGRMVLSSRHHRMVGRRN
ncbi:MAG: MaoC family dehydratase [Dehalococcoidales bacterium]|nr:MaoC family dehydratase [Dehalococcoidales bacterium]